MLTRALFSLLLVHVTLHRSFASQATSQEEEEEKTSYEEVVVVSVSKLQEALVNAPASVSVVSSGDIERSSAQNYGDLLRVVPGLNVIQMSARDVNLRSRAAASTLVTSQLALLDGRTIYHDFFGFVIWDLLSVNPDEIRRVEVLRGPASAVWGANAMTGVVNVISKTPREMEGTNVTIGFGGFDRKVSEEEPESGLLFSLNATHAQVWNDSVAFKISAGTFAQQALPRPTGTIANDFGTPYPTYSNFGTEQPKADFRIDFDLSGDNPDPNWNHDLTFAAGISATEGVTHTGIGPFQIRPGTTLTYGKMNYRRGNFRLNIFANAVDGEAPSLLVADLDGSPIDFVFTSRTYDIEFGNLHLLGNKHLFSYGGNLRHNGFNLSFAPRRGQRDEGGLYLQDEIFISNHVRWMLGVRVDKFDVLDHAVFSPRTSLLIKPARAHTFRLSFNRAFRAPSIVNNFLEVRFLSAYDLGTVDSGFSGLSFAFPVDALGNERLREESLTAYEIGYTGFFGNRTILSGAVYLNEIRDLVQFVQTDYDSDNPPRGWPLDPGVLDDLTVEGRGLPARLVYQNLDRVRDRGYELGFQTGIGPYIDSYVNYSWQGEPEPFGFDLTELNLPPTHRANAGIGFSYGRYFGDISANYVSRAFWQDVLDARFHGPTDPYTIVNAGFGIRWEEGKVTTSIKVTNLTNTEVQQHVFGDIIKRLVVGEIRFRF